MPTDICRRVYPCSMPRKWRHRASEYALQISQLASHPARWIARSPMVGIPSRAKAPWSTSRFARSPSDISQQTFYFFVCEAAEPCNLLSGTVITAFQYLRQSHSLRCIQATQPHIAEQLTAKSISVFPHFLNWNAQTSHGTAATVYVRLFCKAQKIVETSVTAE